MEKYELKKFNKGKEFPKLIVKNKETNEEFNIIGGIQVKDENKIVLENKINKIICSFSTLKKNYVKIGYYG